MLAGVASATGVVILGGPSTIDGPGDLGGPRGYGTQFLGRNDDGSTNEIPLPFPINLYGTEYSSMWVNNNGNMSFNGGVWTYTPDAFPNWGLPMLAPYWADVDTRRQPPAPNQDGNLVYIAGNDTPDSSAVVVTWDAVGRYSMNNSTLNTFQLVLRDAAPQTGNLGDFDVEFRYGELHWTMGSVSSVPAQAGFDAGDNTNFFTLPGSRTSAVVDLQYTSNVSDLPEHEGLWVFGIRTGTPPGNVPENPIMPIPVGNGWNFQFNIINNNPIFIDPILAVGYTYEIVSGPNFQTVILPSVGDDLFDIYGWDGTGYNTLLAGNWAAGAAYTFLPSPGGVNRFQVQGIEVSAALDPDDPTAFVTGLTFAGSGPVEMNMTPITVDTGPAVIPEPVTMFALFSAVGGLGGYLRRRTRKA